MINIEPIKREKSSGELILEIHNKEIQERDHRIYVLEEKLKELADGMAYSYIQNIELDREWEIDLEHWYHEAKRAEEIWKLLDLDIEEEMKEMREHVYEEEGVELEND